MNTNNIKVLQKDLKLGSGELIRISVNREEDSEYHDPKIESIVIEKGDEIITLPYIHDIGLMFLGLGQNIIQYEFHKNDNVPNITTKL